MANDVAIYGDDPYGDSLTIMASDYAQIELVHGAERAIKVRGSRYIDFDINYFSPEAARRLARYIFELADDAEANPELEEFKEDLKRAYAESFGLTVLDTHVAELLYEMGYRKDA